MSEKANDGESTQAAVVASLMRALASTTGAPVKRIETQSAIVLLAGADAYKIRRAIRLPFLDYSTLEKRRAAAEAEMALNRGAAPSIYLEAVAIVSDGESCRFGGAGEVVEWATHMRRFDERATLDKLAERGELTPRLIARLARAIFRSHARAPERPFAPAIASLELWVEQNRLAFAEHPDLFPPALAQNLESKARAALAEIRPLLAERGRAGFVRRCHGDLHLRNLVLLDGEPTPFDAIEFDEAIATGDVLYDLAFAVMDLWERSLRFEANALINAYLVEGEEAHYAGLAALPFFLSLRAAIRAKVEAANRPHVQGEARAKLETTARRYFDFALAFLAPTSARLVAIGGLSGTGKSALARSLASELGRPPGAVWLRSDVERKRLFAVAETTRLGDAAYSAEVSREVYARLNRKAALALGAERAAIIDAAHAHADDRLQSFATARAAGVAFAGLWLEAPLATRLERIAKATPKNYRFTLGVRGAML